MNKIENSINTLRRIKTGTKSSSREKRVYFKLDAPMDIDLDMILDPEANKIPPAPAASGSETPEAKAAREAAELVAKNETPEAKTAREAKEAEDKENVVLATKYGGVKLDDKGNAVDATGKVVKTAEEIIAAEVPAPVAVTLDGKTYKLDKDGNALADDGKVFKTKGELEAIANPDVPLVESLIKKFGITPSKDGKPVVYEDTEEGLMQLVNDVAAVKLHESQKALFKQFPKGEAYIRHLASGGNDEQFFNIQKENYLDVTLDEANIEQQKGLLKQFFIKKGFTPEKADRQVKFSVEANELLPDSKDALATLQKEQKTAKEVADRTNAATQEREEKELEEHWSKVNGLITTGKLTIKNAKGNPSTIVIPEAVRKGFYDYISQPVTDEGYSQAAVDRSKLDLDTRVFGDLLVYLKYDLSKIVNEAVKTEKTKSLRERIAATKARSGIAVAAPKLNEGTTEVSIDTLY